MSNQPPKLLDRVRTVCRRRDYSIHTERAYVGWIRRFVRFHDTTHPRRLGPHEVRAFLDHLATDRDVAPSTHLIEDGYDIRTVQELLGHEDIRTTMKYVHVLNRGGRGAQSPLETL